VHLRKNERNVGQLERWVSRKKKDGFSRVKGGFTISGKETQFEDFSAEEDRIRGKRQQSINHSDAQGEKMLSDMSNPNTPAKSGRR